MVWAVDSQELLNCSTGCTGTVHAQLFSPVVGTLDCQYDGNQQARVRVSIPAVFFKEKLIEMLCCSIL